jgi:FkbM family methyltransferase
MDYEQKLQSFYEAILSPGMNAVDVGAHAGRHAFEIARLVRPGGHVIAFEPVPFLFDGLKAAVAGSRDLEQVISVYPLALSDRSGVTEFCLALDAPGYSGLLEREYDTPTRIERITVNVARLDDYIITEMPIHYIKIDTEGGEWNVIQGGRRVIEGSRPFVSFEFGENSYRNYGVVPGAVFDFFTSNSYCIFDILGRELSRDVFVASSIRQEVWDYIAAPVEKRQLAMLGLCSE